MRVSTAMLLEDAHNGGYAVPMYNTIDLETTRGLVTAAEKLNIPILLGIGYDAIEHMGMEALYRGADVLARAASVPVAIHLDHGRTYEEVAAAVKLGFDSVMIDFSFMEFGENVARTSETAKMSHAMNVPIEAEIGHVPGGENTPTVEDATYMVYTDPKDAADFALRTGVDFLAVSVGTVHGVYKAEPKLNIDLVKEINAAVGRPLVLHGGSGTPADQVRAAVAAGISKVNIGTNVMRAFVKGLRSVPESVMDIRTVLRSGRDEIYNVVAETADMFGTQKANY
ncbi:MAG: class II fructose-bisphosphate aldolase [Synergistaceae bacterium]|nr:class II fructose-bisphosphate aldolase [Synergistaceae bacterium]